MACPCCQSVSPCAALCNGNGVPSVLAIQLTGVSFGANSDVDADDLPFDIPSTFLIPIRDAASTCRIWSEGFFPRDVPCRRCGASSGSSVNGLAINIGRSAATDVLSVQVFMAFGNASQSGGCLGVSSELLNSSAGNVCSLPINGTLNNTSFLCASVNISTVSFTLEAA